MTREKRKYKRYIFPNDENLNLELKLPGKNGKIIARLLNISEGGVGLAVAKEDVSVIGVDTELLIERMIGVKQLEKLREVTGTVRWVINHKPLEHLGIGCEFVNLSEDGRKEITKLVNG